MKFLADSTSMPPPSLMVIAVMLLMLAAAGYVFWRLTHHWTRGRRMAALQEWARSVGMKLHLGEEAALPPALSRLGPEPRVRVSIHGKHTAIIQLQTQSSKANEPLRRWHALVRQLGTPSPLVGLRPAHAPASLLDLVSARTFPALIPPDRFVVIGEERVAAEALVASSVRALLPADVGMVLLDDCLVLDFSSRPYDGIEFSRLLAIVDQITPHLPQDAPARDAV